jgi:hypothetical protein
VRQRLRDSLASGRGAARAKDPLDGLTSFRVAVCQPFGGDCVSDQDFALVVL